MYPIHQNSRVLVAGILRMDFLFKSRKEYKYLCYLCYCICEVLVREIKAFEKKLVTL